MRVLYLIYGYPQASQTYIKTELEAVSQSHDVKIISTHQAKVTAPYRNHLPYEHISDTEQIAAAVEEFRPDVMHGHHLREIRTLHAVAERTGVPFTIRTHSFDVLERAKREQLASRLLGPLARRGAPKKVRDSVDLVRDDLCLGLVAFPFVRPKLEKAGFPAEKISDCWPVVNYDLFHDRGPNGDAVMNSGACIPKKNMEDYVRLAAMVPERTFNLYALGYKTDEITAFNKAQGEPVNMIQNIEPDDMRPEYKKHEWVVYTASKQIGTVGWPMTVAEAQAAGVGVAMQRIRPDLEEYVGPGFCFDSIDEVPKLLAQPFPQELREQGFEHARRSDINTHLSTLTSLWDRATSSNPA